MGFAVLEEFHKHYIRNDGSLFINSHLTRTAPFQNKDLD